MTDPLLTAIHLAATAPSLASALVVLNGGLRRQWEFAHSGCSRLDSRVIADGCADPSVREQLLREASAASRSADVRCPSRVAQALAVCDPRIETALESISWAKFIRAGIELPVPQVRLRGASGILRRVDFLFGTRVIGECDGAVKYHSGYTAWEEKRRQSDLEAAGYIVVRWTWAEITRQPDRVLARLALAVSRAA